MRSLLALTICVLGATTALAGNAAAQDAGQSRTILVNEGGSYDVSVHPDFVTVFYLPDRITKALASDTTGYEVKPIGDKSLAIRPLKADAKPANLALATESIKVSVVLRVAKSRDEALTQVTFKRADVEAEVQRRIDDGVKKRTAELEAKIADMQKTMDAELPKVADGLIAARLLQRRELRKLGVIERNDDNVVVEATEVFFLGEDAYVVFQIENRNKAPYRLAAAQVLDGKADRAGVVRFVSDAAESAGKGVIGVVRPGGKGAGVVVVRRSGDLLGKNLDLVISEPGGRGKVVVDRVVLR
jgi:hypothetical protein